MSSQKERIEYLQQRVKELSNYRLNGTPTQKEKALRKELNELESKNKNSDRQFACGL